MTDNHRFLSLYGRSPLFQMFASLFIVLVTGIILFILFLLAGSLLFDMDLMILLVQNPESPVENNINLLRYLLISQDISMFIVPALIILFLMKPGRQEKMMVFKLPRLYEVLLVIALTFCIFPLTSFTGQLNSWLDLPEWLSGFEKWITEKEENANLLIDTLIIPDTFRVMLVNLVILAFIPAVGEELIFRGVLQRIFHNLFRSGHPAIWITSVIFSAIHFQFFEFVPRMILGLVFGYLFFWGQNIWLPVISHFVNNAVPVLGSYIWGWEDFNTYPDVPVWKQITGLLIPLIISLLILNYFRHQRIRGKI